MSKDEIIEEIKKTLKELTESQKKTEKEIAALTESQKKTNQEITKLTEKTDKEIANLSKEVNKVNKMVGDLTDGWGKFVEGIVEPSCVKLAGSLGMKVKRVYRRVKAQVEGEEVEVDIIIEGDKNGKGTLLVVEAKSHFEPDDMQEFLGWFFRFFKFFDVYKDYEVMGAVASPRFGNGVQKRAQKEGLWVLIPSGDMMKITNPKGFKPKILRY